MVSSVTTEKLDIAYDEALIVSELAIQIPKGQISSIIGPNGCGKSTILKAIGRILKPKCGAVYLSGDDIRRLPTKEVARRMAILPQSPTAPAGLSVSNLIAYGRFPHQKGFGNLTTEDKRIINWAIEVTRLEDFKHREVDSLSGGQRQRVWIAMALAQQTDLILLDEPTTYLDLAHQLDVLDFLHSLNTNQGTTIAMVLHDLNMAARFSDYMIAICEGRVIRRGTPEDVLRPEVLRQAFNIDAEIVKDPRTGRPTCITYDLIGESANGASAATGSRVTADTGAQSVLPVPSAASPKGSLAAATEGRQAVRA